MKAQNTLKVSVAMVESLNALAAWAGDYKLSLEVEHNESVRDGEMYDYAEVTFDIINKTFIVNIDGEIIDNHGCVFTKEFFLKK